MPKLVRYLGLHCAVGFALGVVFGGLIVLSNAGGLRDLLVGSPDIMIALPLLLGMCGLTMAGLVMAGAIMTMPESKEDGRD